MPLFRERVSLGECAAQLPLRRYTPVLTLEGLVAGVDNVRHDVFLSPKFTQVARAYITRLIVEYGEVQDLLAAEKASPHLPPSIVTPDRRERSRSIETSEFSDLLLELLTAALNRAKSERNPSLDKLCRLSLIKFLRMEMIAQYASTLERCRARLRSYDVPRQGHPQKSVQWRERTSRLQLAKRAILRRIGQELFAKIRDAEKSALARMRRSLLGEGGEPEYELFLNRLLFTDDGKDDFINAEHYVMLGNFPRDPDRLPLMLSLAHEFLKELGYPADEAELDAILNDPENAHILFAGANPDESSPQARFQRAALNAWVERLENEQVMSHVIASYEAVGLLGEYSPPINPQQLKNALISRSEYKRLEALLDEHGRLSAENLLAALRRVEHCRGPERSRIAARFLTDFMRYLRDLRRLETLNEALDAVNLVTSDKVRELSAINHTLYEFLLPEEQKPAEQLVIHHIVVKADIRDSTQLTRTLYERGLNPASYFSLNFYEPVNKLLPKYGAQKLFIEGDAVILALFEHAGETGLGVGRACVLAKEIIEIVRAYNEQSQKAGLPALELGIGIAYQDTAPMYLMDGGTRIMISPALNAGDRLSSCSRSARRFCAGVESVFNVFAFQTIDDADTAGQPDEFLIRYNIGGIVLDEDAFTKLQQEISLSPHDLALPTLWEEGKVRLFSGVVPVAPEIFHKIIVREARIPHIDAREFQLKEWTGRKYYEVCTNPAVYELLESQTA
jgi:hypothetical protein